MADLFKVVKTTRKVQNNIEKFESLSIHENEHRSNTNKPPPVIEVDDPSTKPGPLLTAVSSTLNTSNHAQSITSPTNAIKAPHKRHDSTAFIQKSYLKNVVTSLVDDAREILKSQPGLEDVEAVLQYLQYGIDGQHDFNIKITSPKASLLVHVLVATTLPDLWTHLQSKHLSDSDLRMRDTLSAGLLSVTGIGAILEQIRFCRTQPSSKKFLIQMYLGFLANMLEDSDTILRLLHDAEKLYTKDVQRRLFWQGIVSLLAGGKVLSTAASTIDDQVESPSWLSNGPKYSQWLGRNIVKASLVTPTSDTVAWSNLGQLLRSSLSLGYRDALVKNIYTSLLLGQHALWSPLHGLVKELPLYAQKTVFDCVLNDLSHQFFNTMQDLSPSSTDMTTAKAISGAAALIYGLVSHNEHLMDCAIEWVASPDGSNRGSGLRRALITVLAQSQDKLERILERSLTMFSDKVQIQNMSAVQQDHLAQVILLVIGRLRQQHPASLKNGSIPTLSMQSVTNRLTSSVPHTRLLGMIVGVGMSRCVDEPSMVMDFKVDEMDTREVKDLLALVGLNDKIGTVDDLRTEPPHEKAEQTSKKRKIFRRESVQPSKMSSKITAIEELSSSSDDEVDLVPYRKPLQDHEDSEEDATLIDRNKPKAPIYIVDLIKQLQLPSDKLEVISLALKTSAGLIKRKAEFGTELSDNIHGLASTLINLQDGMSKPAHQQQRLDAVVACLVAQPEAIGKYLSATYFNGDFSLSQRSTILIAIGLGARQLAGYTDASKTSNSAEIDLFPSERLPSHLQPKPLTSSGVSPAQAQRNPVAALSIAATHDMIRPLAMAAAESQAGPKILQVNRTSSSSLTNKAKQQQISTRKIPKKLNQIFTNSIYLPLASPLTTILSYISANPSSSNTAALILHPSILTLHLQTLTLILHTIGPTGLSAPANFNTITHETLLLLTCLTRNNKLSFDGVVLPALLGLLLALIDMAVEIGVTAQERLLSDEFGGTVSELVRWVSSLEDNGAPPPTKNEDGRGAGGVAWTVLAAGIQVRWMEIGKRFQGRMLGLGDEEVW